MHLIFCFILSAHAGVVREFCERCLSVLVADDPYEFESASIAYVSRTLDHLCIAKRWRKLNKYEQSAFDRLTRELEMRRSYGPDVERDLADEALIRCAQ